MNLTIKDFDQISEELLDKNEKNFTVFAKKGIKGKTIKNKLLNEAFEIFKTNEDQVEVQELNNEVVEAYCHAIMGRFVNVAEQYGVELNNCICEVSLVDDAYPSCIFTAQGDTKEMKQKIKGFLDKRSTIDNIFSAEDIARDFIFENRDY